jgi:hypothetical protein
LQTLLSKQPINLNLEVAVDGIEDKMAMLVEAVDEFLNSCEPSG